MREIDRERERKSERVREIEREREREREKEKREKNVFTKHDGVANKLLPFLYVFY